MDPELLDKEACTTMAWTTRTSTTSCTTARFSTSATRFERLLAKVSGSVGGLVINSQFGMLFRNTYLVPGSALGDSA